MGKVPNFSPSSLDGLSAGRIADPLVPGLCISVSASGRKTWHFRRRVARSGAVVKMTLGTFPTYPIPAARTWATELNAAIERGEDPRETKRVEESREALTVAKAHAIYMEAMRRGDRKTLKARTLYDKEVIFTRDIEPRLGQAGLLKLTENECWDAVYDKAKASKVRANKMAGELSCFLKWCAGREGRMAGIELMAHPAPTLNSNWFSTGPKANKRFLSDEEIMWFMQALVEEPLVYRRGFILLMLTAARRNELFGAPASEFVDGVWTLPSERSKNGEENYVALAPWGRALAQTNHEWLFPSPRLDGPQLFGWFKARARVHARMEKMAGESIPSWHFHDFRRTFRSNARRVAIDRDIAELMLNHILEVAEQMEASSHQLETRVFARDQSLRGRLRVTLPPFFASHLLMPDFADFARLHPDIEMEIFSTGEVANLTNREADVAIRAVVDRKTLPLNLHALMGPQLAAGVYLSRDLLATWRKGLATSVRVIVINDHGMPGWAAEAEIPTTAVPFRTPDAEAQIAAVRQGIGMTRLPCFVGDADPLLVRAPGIAPHLNGALWLLTQGETRKTKRVRIFIEFVSRRLAAYTSLLAGEAVLQP